MEPYIWTVEHEKQRPNSRNRVRKYCEAQPLTLRDLQSEQQLTSLRLQQGYWTRSLNSSMLLPSKQCEQM